MLRQRRRLSKNRKKGMEVFDRLGVRYMLRPSQVTYLGNARYGNQAV